MSQTMWIILFGAIGTYLTRIGGHLVLSRFKSIHPRVQAGLDAVPAAVLTTLVAPAVFNAGPAEWVAITIAGVIGWFTGIMPMFIAGAAVIIALRSLFGV
ncbi:MAG: AzlD family protein [Notoacmeibacter sp.]|nr:AzlD family protein [Notoacmeibacter sp.]